MTTLAEPEIPEQVHLDAPDIVEAFRDSEEHDRNAWWRLEAGDQRSLFDAACEQLDAAHAEIERLHEEYGNAIAANFAAGQASRALDDGFVAITTEKLRQYEAIANGRPPRPATDRLGRACTVYVAPEACPDPDNCRVHYIAPPGPEASNPATVAVSWGDEAFGLDCDGCGTELWSSGGDAGTVGLDQLIAVRAGHKCKAAA